MGPNYKDWKKSQNRTLDNLYISYDINESQKNEVCRECDANGKMLNVVSKNPRTWEM